MPRFIILGQPRSGTTHLNTLLNSHPEVICAGESFDPYIVMGMSENASDAAVLARDAAPRRAAEPFFEQAEAEGIRAAGFKFMLGHDIAVLRWIARNPDIRIIYIHRAKKLAQVCSLIKANQTRKWVNNEVANTPLRRCMHRLRIVYQDLFDLGRKEGSNLVPTIRDIDGSGRLTVARVASASAGTIWRPATFSRRTGSGPRCCGWTKWPRSRRRRINGSAAFSASRPTPRSTRRCASRVRTG